MRNGMMRQYHSWLSFGQRVLDSVLVLGVLVIICYIYLGDFHKVYMVAATVGALLTWITLGAFDVYREWRGSSLWKELQTLLLGWFVVTIVLITLACATKSSDTYSRIVISAWFILSPLVLAFFRLGIRLFLRYIRRKGKNTRRAIIVGAGVLGQQLAGRIQDSKWMGVDLIGFFDDNQNRQGTNVKGITIQGTTRDVYTFVKQKKVDQVYLALPMSSDKQMKEVFDELQDTTASIYLLPDLFVFELLGARQQEVAGMPAFALCETPFLGAFGALKRLEDIVLSSVILSCIWPIMIAIAISIKMTSKGPVLFKQTRYGLNGERIKIYKFRSMVTMDNDDTVIQQATKYDIRITKLGMFLRRTSLDELPQFINVLQGRMSVVGPRPHAVAHNEQYRKLIKGYMWRHKVKPGITGWAQINGWRGETDTLNKMEKRVEHDLEYIRRWSILLDLKIVFLTIFKGFIDKKAY